MGYGVSNSCSKAGSISSREVPSGKVLLDCVFIQNILTITIFE
jgi:hypothetical protein